MGNTGYTVRKAVDGGFYVVEEVDAPLFRLTLFAGSLAQCLDYIRTKFNGAAA